MTAVAPPESSVTRLAGAVLAFRPGGATIEFFIETTDEQLCDALSLLPLGAELVDTTYDGGEFWKYEW